MLLPKKDARLSAALGATLETALQGRSPWAAARTRFVRNRAAMLSLLLLGLITLLCLIGPWLLPHAFDSSDWQAMSLGPTWLNMHWFGTDESGRDLLVRCLVGGRISLMVGLLATLASVSIGIAWGATAGFIGGRVDALMMRVVDMMYAVPYLLIAILMVTLLGRAFYLVVLTITVFSWMDMARVVRGQTLSLRSREFVEAARAIGVPTRRIIFQHIVPNLLGVVVIYTTVTVPGVTTRVTWRSTGPFDVAGSPICSQIATDSPSFISLARYCSTEWKGTPAILIGSPAEAPRWVSVISISFAARTASSKNSS